MLIYLAANRSRATKPHKFDLCILITINDEKYEKDENIRGYNIVVDGKYACTMTTKQS